MRSKLFMAVEWLGENQLFLWASYAMIAATLVAAYIETGLAPRSLSATTLITAIALCVVSGLLFVFSIVNVASYFLFIPSLKNDAALFSTVHASHLLHPLTSAFVFGLLALNLFTGGTVAWVCWVGLVLIYAVHTYRLTLALREESEQPQAGTLLLTLNLIFGGEIVTMAAGGKPLAPWRINTLPENTWIVDVRTKHEFQWNRMGAAENFPWGMGLREASQTKSKDTPVLVVCLSGHRSPAVALSLRRLGFKSVHNLTWGLLYLMLLKKGEKGEGPFALTRSQEDAHRRGKDFRGISLGYIFCALVVLIAAPIEQHIMGYAVSSWQQLLAGALLLVGGALGFASYRALGRNFRVFAAPRRSGTLVTTGVYSRIRHPMYIAVIALIGGYGLLFASRIAFPFWLALTALYIVKAIKEERLLSAKYNDYDAYCERTWRFIPYVW